MKSRWTIIFLLPISLWCGNTTSTKVLFQPSSPSVGPFPANALTVASTGPMGQKTGLQISLPFPANCSSAPGSTECVNTVLLNYLDGFSVNPRITVCFSGPVNVNSLTAGISIISVDRPATTISINQVIFDPAGNCAYAKPDHVLDQGSRYVIAITSDVTDTGGKSVTADGAFGDCLKKGTSDYCHDLSHAVSQIDNSELVAASLFTTMSATSWLEGARTQVNSGTIPEAVYPAGPVYAFDLNSVRSITWTQDLGMGADSNSQTIPLSALWGVDRVAFGLYLSPLYLNLTGPQAGSISTTPTNAASISPPSLVAPVSFHVFLPPARLVPSSGKIPVIIYGHGLGDSQFGAPTFAASVWAQEGFATLAIEIPGHGFGQGSTTLITSNNGSAVTVLTPGRGIQFASRAPIGPTNGCILPNAIATRDCARQTAVDLFAMVRAIRDTNGLGLNLDSSRIYYVGQSFGSIYGTLFEAVEPNVSAGTLNVGGGSQTDIARLSPIARALGAAYLDSFSPSLLNVLNAPHAPPQAYFHDGFNDEYVYRGQAITHRVAGALAVQAAFEQAEWLGMLGDPLSFAPHLKKPTLIQFGLGDLEVPNPTESALVRAGGFQQQTWMLRTDFAASIDPSLLSLTYPGVGYPIYPHRFLSNPTLFNLQSSFLETLIAVAAQKQIADFFASRGTSIPDPNQYLLGLPLFEIPAVLPDRLNFLQIKP